MVKIYKSNYRQRIKHFWSFYLFLGAIMIFVLFAIYKFGIRDLGMYLKIMLMPFILFILPTIYIHIEYYFTNRNDILKIDDTNYCVEYTHKNKTIVFNFNDIHSIEQFKTPVAIEKRESWVPWDSYNHSKVTLHDGSKITITCYLIDEFDLPIGDEKKKLHRVLFPRLKH